MAKQQTIRRSKKSRSGIPASDRVVFVGGIPRETTQSDLRKLFDDLVGGVQKVRFVIAHTTRHHKGYGFCRLETAEQAKALVDFGRRGIFVYGKQLNVGDSFEAEKSLDNDSSEEAITAEQVSEDDSRSSVAKDEECEFWIDELLGDELPSLQDDDVDTLLAPAAASVAPVAPVAAVQQQQQAAFVPQTKYQQPVVQQQQQQVLRTLPVAQAQPQQVFQQPQFVQQQQFIQPQYIQQPQYILCPPQYVLVQQPQQQYCVMSSPMTMRA